MTKEYDPNYGADADGNRGEGKWFYTLEHTEEEDTEIAEVLFGNGFSSDDTGEVEIRYDDIDIEVEVHYYSALIKELEDEDDRRTIGETNE